MRNRQRVIDQECLAHVASINVTLGHLNLESFGYKQGTDYYQKRQGQHLKGGACQ